MQPGFLLLLDWEVTVLKDPATLCVGRGGTHQLWHIQSSNWQFDGTDYKWTGTTSAGGGNFDEDRFFVHALSGSTFSRRT